MVPGWYGYPSLAGAPFLPVISRRLVLFLEAIGASFSVDLILNVIVEYNVDVIVEVTNTFFERIAFKAGAVDAQS
jgi:hypothetical protein